MDNFMRTEFFSKSSNEGFARAAVSAFLSQLDPTIEQLAEIKTAVSEAVTNAIVHGYGSPSDVDDKLLYIAVTLYEDRSLKISVRDHGRGIPDVAAAREPLFTTDDSGDRSGMGFSVMEAFCDRVEVMSRVGEGTKVTLYKTLT